MSWANRILGAAGRGILRAIAAAQKGGYPQLKVSMPGGDTPANVSHMTPAGFGHKPPDGADAIVLALGPGDLVAVVVADKRYTLEGAAAGEVWLCDDQGQRFHLTRSGPVIAGQTVAVEADNGATVTAPEVTVDSADVKLGAAATQGVARVGDAVQVTDEVFTAWISAITGYVNGIAPGTWPYPAPTAPTGVVTAGSTRVKAD